MTTAVYQSTNAVAVARVRKATVDLRRDLLAVSTDRATMSARWDAIDVQYADAVDALIADLEGQIARGEFEPFEPEDL